MAEPSIEELQRENAELRERLDKLRKLLHGVVESRTVLDVVGPETRSRMINSMSPSEMGPHLREVALSCIRLARESTDARAALELEHISIELADRAGSLEAIFSSMQRDTD
jgi:hypothetical protein